MRTGCVAIGPGCVYTPVRVSAGAAHASDQHTTGVGGAGQHDGVHAQD